MIDLKLWQFLLLLTQVSKLITYYNKLWELLNQNLLTQFSLNCLELQSRLKGFFLRLETFDKWKISLLPITHKINSFQFRRYLILEFIKFLKCVFLLLLIAVSAISFILRLINILISSWIDIEIESERERALDH